MPVDRFLLQEGRLVPNAQSGDLIKYADYQRLEADTTKALEAAKAQIAEIQAIAQSTAELLADEQRRVRALEQAEQRASTLAVQVDRLTKDLGFVQRAHQDAKNAAEVRLAVLEAMRVTLDNAIPRPPPTSAETTLAEIERLLRLANQTPLARA